MKKKKVFPSELAYIIGLILLALSAAFMEKSDFGVSMVVAPAYLLHLKISQYWPFYSFGMSEYVLQAFLLIAMCLIFRKFKKGYLFSFVTAVIYGNILDFFMMLVALLPFSGMMFRVICYIFGVVVGPIGISLLFHTYITPEAYELVVKEVAAKTGKDINKVKWCYDICSCLFAVILSFAFYGFGNFVGVKAGTIICALVNGWLIGFFSKILEPRFNFEDKLPWRPFFEE